MNIAQMNVLRAEVARLKELVAVKDQLLTSKEAQLAMKDELLASRAEEAKRLKKELQLRVGSSDANNACDYPDCNAKRQRMHDSSSSCYEVSPLDKDDLLDQVFSFAGGGDHLYIAGVSRRWRGRYLKHCIISGTSNYDKKFVTRHRSTLLSASRLQLALNSGLTIAEVRQLVTRRAHLQALS
jgi:hypothetical protein